MRLLFLGVHPHDHSPSQRYRFEAFEPAIRAAGFEITYANALSRTEERDFAGRVGVARKATIAARAALRRMLSLRHQADVVFVQREAFFLLGPWSEWLASLRAPVIFDFDDAIWMHAVSAANARFAFLKNVEKIPRIVSRAHTVIAGNDYLASWARQHSSRVQVIPTCVDTDRFSPGLARPTRDSVTIGWSGSPSTFAHLERVLPVLERVKARFGERVKLRVMGNPGFSYAPLALHGEAWTPQAELSLLREMDIGVMPLPDDAWTRGKCGLKGLVSMSVGAATVMSPVGVNTSIVTDGENGFLARTDDEWFEVLSRLIEDRELRARIGAAGRERVVADYSVSRWSQPLVDVLTRSVSSR